jgi:hypothetical protein
MIKLIKELAKQANEDTRSLMIMEYANFESHLYERFAELVAMKCVELCEESGPNDHIDYTVQRIKTQFGLK